MESDSQQMSYLKVPWHHDHKGEPVELYSELDAARMEMRKVEVYRDGRQDFADADRALGATLLGERPIPPFEEIAAMDEFTPTIISSSEFEAVWRRATGT